jgi:hypothetical protein
MVAYMIKKLLIFILGLMLISSMVFGVDLIEIEKSTDITQIIAGDTYTSSISVTCTGNCYDVSVWDTLPTGFTGVDGAPTPVINGSVWSWYYIGLTNSTEIITFWGVVSAYTNHNVTNSAEAIGSNVVSAVSTLVLNMATPTPTFTATPSTSWSTSSSFGTEIRGFYKNVSSVVINHNWNTDRYRVTAIDGNGNGVIRRERNYRTVTLTAVDFIGTTITTDIEYSVRK